LDTFTNAKNLPGWEFLGQVEDMPRENMYGNPIPPPPPLLLLLLPPIKLL
jgi:hypothetical protein